MRQLLRLLRLDTENFGTENWNPFGSFISPGQTVLLKPNFVRHFNEYGSTKGLITSGSLIRAVADYAYIALKGSGRIIIADGPMDDADFKKIIELTGLYEIREFYRKNSDFDLEIYDLRREQVIRKGEKIIQRIMLQGDPRGYSTVDLGNISKFKKDFLDYKSFRGAECRQDIMYLHHNEDRHEYLISNTLLNADVIINLPKMKTHGKSGVTLALKNMIGIIGDRNWLPHYTVSGCGNGKSPAYSKAIKSVFSFAKKLSGGLPKIFIYNLKEILGRSKWFIREGEWYRNDIIWRTILDIAHIVLHADKKGAIRHERQRRMFTVIDGIVAGEGAGPINPRSKPCGLLAASFSSISIDVVTTRLMGFDPMKIPKFKNIAAEADGFDFGKIRCISNVKEWNKYMSDFKGKCLGFRPHYGWKGHIEINKELSGQ